MCLPAPCIRRLRISVGIESVSDIIADIEQALEAVSEPGADRGPQAGSPLGVVDATGS